MKKKLLRLGIILCSCFLLSLCIEVFVFHFHHLKNNQKIDIQDSSYHNFDKEKDYFISHKDSYIKIDQVKYISKIAFDYQSHKNFSWKVIGYSNNTPVYEKQFSSLSTLSKSIKPIQAKMDSIKISINQEGIKMKHLKVDNQITINWYRILFMVTFLSVLVYLIINRKFYFKNIHRLFLMVMIPIGTMLIICLPQYTYTSWDDQIHIRYVYSILSGDHIKTSNAIEEVVKNKKFIDKEYITTYEERIELNKYLNQQHQKRKIEFNNNYHLEYNTLVYLPFAIGFQLGQLLGMPFILTIIISKLFNYLLYVVLIYYAIKIIPFGKKIVLMIATLPMNLFLVTQFSYDPTITAALILFFSLFIKEMKTNHKLDLKTIMALLFSILWASFPKAIYIPCILFLLLLKDEKFQSKKQARIFKGLIILLFMIVMSSFVLPSIAGSMEGDSRGGETSVSGQMSFILHQPFSFSKTFIKTAVVQIFSSFLGIKTLLGLGYMEIEGYLFNEPIYYFSLILLFYYIFRSDVEFSKFPKKFKILTIFILIMIYSMIWVSMYLSFTPVGLNTINGVQGRYFIPIMLPVFFMIANKGLIKNKNNNMYLYILYLMAIAIYFYQAIHYYML